MIFKRSLVSELANSAGGVFTVMFAIILAVGMVSILGLAGGGKIDNTAMLQLVLYNALVNLPPLLALSLFIGVLMTMMRWWQDNEMVVWFTSGARSLLAWVSPVLRFSIPVILAIAALSIVISPWARSQSEVTRSQFEQRDDVNHLAPGRFIETKGGKRIFFIETIKNGNEVGNVFVAELADDKQATVTAESGRIEKNADGDRYIVLHNGRRYETKKDSAMTRVIEFDKYGVRLDIKLDGPMQSRKLAAQPTSLLMAAQTPRSQGELFWRFCWPLVAFNLALMAVPLSCTNPRAGRSLNLVCAALIFILYLNGVSVLQSIIENGSMHYLTALFALNGSVFLLTAILYYRWVAMMRWLPPWMSFWYWRHKKSGRA